MITFHNDNLVAPEFCRLIYQTIPEGIHVPVIFASHEKHCACRGGWGEWKGYVGHTNGTYVCLHLSTMYYFTRGAYREFDFWKKLLHTTYHEFGHIATYHEFEHRQGMYENDPKAHDNIESRANWWADLQMANLAEHNKRLAQPARLGPYFDGREAKQRLRMHPHNGYRGVVSYRLRMTGGQFTITDVAGQAGEYGNTALIRKLAADLASTYTDHAGRVLFFFAYGDLGEIKRRVAAHRAVYPKHVRQRAPLAPFDLPGFDPLEMAL
jgi:hypothetical protein